MVESRTGFSDAEPGHVCSATRIHGEAATFLAFQPGGALLTGNDQGLLKWRAADGQPTERFELREGPLSPCGVDGAGRFVLLRSRDAAGRQLMWLDSRQHRRQLLSGPADAVQCRAVRGQQVLAGDAAGRALLWDAGRRSAALQLAPTVQRRHHGAAVNCCALSADGRLAATGEPSRRWSGPPGCLRCAARRRVPLRCHHQQALEGTSRPTMLPAAPPPAARRQRR